MPRRFGAVATRRHVAPATAAILRTVEEDARAAAVRAPTDAAKLTENHRVGGRFDDRDHEAGERVADRDEGARIASIGTQLHAARTRAAAKHAIDLGQRVEANLRASRSALGEGAQCGTNATSVDERCRRAGRLLQRPTPDALRTLEVEHGRRLEPQHERVEVVQRITGAHWGFSNVGEWHA